MDPTSFLIRAWRGKVTQLVAIALVVTTYVLARQPSGSPDHHRSLTSRFRFSRLSIDVDRFAHGQLRHVRRVHPSLQRISAWISATGAAATLADLDGDGLPNDLCLVDPRVDRVVILPAPSTGERFLPFVPDPTPLYFDSETMSPTGTVTGDFNEDGRADMLVYYWGRTPIIFLRKAISDSQTTALGPSDYFPCELLASDDRQSTPIRWYTHAATQADVDGDGHFDLILGNFFQDGADILNPRGTGVASVMQAGKSKALNGGGGKLFVWQSASSGQEPGVHFRNATSSIEQHCGRGWVLAAGAADLDDDALPEIYLANDFGPDRLLHNRSRPGTPQFVLVEGQRTLTTPKSFALGHDSFKGMGVDFADVNGDGSLDIYVSNIADQWALQESHFLWLSSGRSDLFKTGVAPYVQGSERLGVSRSGWGWDSKFADFDNDGTCEAMQATGFIKGATNRWPELQALGTSNERIIHDPRFWPRFQPGDDVSGHNRNPFFVIGPDGRFLDVSAQLGLDAPMNSRGLAIADVDGDGRLDFVAANQWQPSYLFKNESPVTSTFVGLHLLLPIRGAEGSDFKLRAGHPGPDTPGRPAIGARAVVRVAGNRPLVAQVDGGNGHSGRRSPDLHFGLGSLPDSQPIGVDLTWRDARGDLCHRTIQVTAGWHTILLGSATEVNTQ